MLAKNATKERSSCEGPPVKANHFRQKRKRNFDVLFQIKQRKYKKKAKQIKKASKEESFTFNF